MKNYRIYILFFIVSLVTSCERENLPFKLTVDAEIETVAEGTKAVITGNRFSTGNAIGIFVYYDEYVPYSQKYMNIRATYSSISPNWSYRLAGANSDFSDGIYLRYPDVEYSGGVHISAYSPWIDGVEDIRSIPFTVGGEYKEIVDLMYAIQNQGISNTIIPDGADKRVELTFKHSMSMLRLGFRCKHDQSKVSVTSVTLEKKDGGSTPLYVSGVFNALTGEFASLVPGGSVTTSYSGQNYAFDNTGYLYLPFLILPGEYKADGDYILKFKFDGQDLEAVYEIKKSDISKFDPGYSYTFNFTFNNYVQIDGVTVNVSGEWVEEEHEFLF